MNSADDRPWYQKVIEWVINKIFPSSWWGGWGN